MKSANNPFGRREFLRAIAAIPLLPLSCTRPFSWLENTAPRRVTHRFLKDGKPLLVVVEGDNVKRMLDAGLGALAGFAEAVASKDQILLKPNATTFQPYPVTTDPEILTCFTRTLREINRAPIALSDSPSYAGLTAHHVFLELGYFDLGRKEGVRVQLIDPLVGSQYARVSFSGSRCHPSLLIHRRVQESDFIVNFAIPKRHHVADFTCAMKNNFGCVYETYRALAHSGPAEFFDRSIVEFADAVQPDLTIVDARQLLAGSGPSFKQGESEIVKNVNKLVLSSDMVAVDWYCAGLMERYDRTFSKRTRVQRQLDNAVELGLGTDNPRNVSLVEIST